MAEIRPKIYLVISTLLFAAMAAHVALLGGCSASGDTRPDAPAAEVLESKVVELDEGSAAHAERWADGLVRVEIEEAELGLRFAAELRQADDETIRMAYELYPALTEENVSPQVESSSLALDMKELPSLDDAITGAVFLYTQLSRAVLGLQDNWGCDLLPRRFNWIASCGPKGRCCDIHDACYARHRCTASSWKRPPWHKCQVRCNAPAVLCFTNPVPVGPSVCCARGNCGRPR